MSKTGIYKIEDLKGRIYIGSAVDFGARRSLHLKNLRKGNHHSKKLQRVFDKYGSDSLTFTLLEVCERPLLLTREQVYLDLYSPYFNTCMVAGSPLGVKRSQQFKDKISESNRRRVLSDETKDKIRQKALGRRGHMSGKHHRQETKDKISAARLLANIVLSPEHKAKLTFKGGKHSDEHKKRLSERQKGSTLSPETRAKISLSRKGFRMSEETKQKISQTQKQKRECLISK